MGVDAIDFGLGIGDVLTSKTSLQSLQQQSEIRHTFNEWLQSLHSKPLGRNVDIESGTIIVPILQQFDSVTDDNEIEIEDIDGNVNEHVDETLLENSNDVANISKNECEPVHIEMDDIDDEINY